jgi:hypothetical protein
MDLEVPVVTRTPFEILLVATYTWPLIALVINRFFKVNPKLLIATQAVLGILLVLELYRVSH